MHIGGLVPSERMVREGICARPGARAGPLGYGCGVLPAPEVNGSEFDTCLSSFNTRQSLFTNIEARQALSYAIDRARILQFTHLASGQATATCQILPADLPGHQSYCPYTAGNKDGELGSGGVWARLLDWAWPDWRAGILAE